MRISCLSVSDQLGGSEVSLLGMVTDLERLCPTWEFQVVLPGEGPLRQQLNHTRAMCSVVPMPAALSRMGEWAAVQDGWSTASQLSLGIKVCGAAAALPGYESRLARAISVFRPDIIHTNGLKAHVLGARLRAPQAHLVWHLHEYISRRKLTRWLLRRYKTRCSAILANSQSVAEDVTESLGPAPHVEVVPNSVDLDVFSPNGPRLDLDRLAGLDESSAPTIRVGLVATYGRWKGHEVFLDAMQQVGSRLSMRGYIIGGPIYDSSDSQLARRDLQAMIDSRRLSGRVGLTGFVESAPAMRALDIVVHASTEPEPFGLVIAEAMACGRAVITTGYGGAKELIADGHDALVSPAGDAPALAEAIERLGADSTRRRVMGEHARQSACIRFQSRRVVSQVARVFGALATRPAMAQSA